MRELPSRACCCIRAFVTCDPSALQQPCSTSTPERGAQTMARWCRCRPNASTPLKSMRCHLARAVGVCAHARPCAAPPLLWDEASAAGSPRHLRHQLPRVRLRARAVDLGDLDAGAVRPTGAAGLGAAAACKTATLHALTHYGRVGDVAPRCRADRRHRPPGHPGLSTPGGTGRDERLRRALQALYEQDAVRMAARRATRGRRRAGDGSEVECAGLACGSTAGPLNEEHLLSEVDFKLQGRTTVITGSTGIGAACARRLARDGAALRCGTWTTPTAARWRNRWPRAARGCGT